MLVIRILRRDTLLKMASEITILKHLWLKSHEFMFCTTRSLARNLAVDLVLKLHKAPKTGVQTDFGRNLP
jgi:hypothetical protein